MCAVVVDLRLTVEPRRLSLSGSDIAMTILSILLQGEWLLA